jgi:dTDP-glucose 4,6-dehydratase/UDP-glucose 4-epimerase
VTAELRGRFAGKQALVTGGLGFIGSNLARRLVRDGAKVTIVDSLDPKYGGNRYNIADIESNVAVDIADVRDAKAMETVLAEKDYVFNLAGQTGHVDSMTDPTTDLEINCAAQLGMLEACRRVSPNVKIVFTSTRQLYGKPDYLPVDERHPIRPVDVNGINKWSGEQYHILYNNVYGIRAAVLRLTNTYGPGMRVKDARQTFVGLWVRQLLEGRPIRIFGDGTQLRDLIYVEDCVDAIVAAAAEGAAGRIYNVGSPEVVSLNELAETMVSLGYGGTFERVPFPPDRAAIDIGDYYTDISLIRKELGWAPRVSLREGLESTVSFYRKHLPHFV